MAKSSINFAKASAGGLRHNDRTEVPSYLLPKEFRLSNDCDISAKEAEKKIQDLYSTAKDKYQEKFGQRLQSKSYTWEAVINLNKEHTLEDVQRLTKEIEKETGFTSVQVAIHRDEGRVEKSKAGEIVPIYNLHAHVTFFTLDKETGEQLYRRQVTDQQKKREIKPMNRERLSKIQDLTAKSLGMERGKKGSKAVRLEHKAYKATKQAELAKQKDLKEEIKELRAKLQEQDAIREDYAKLEQLNKELKERIRLKELTISELEEIKANYFAMKREYNEETTAIVKSELDEALETIEIQSEKIAKLEEDNSEISWQKEKIEEELAEEKDKNEVLAEEVAEVLEENKKWADAYDTLKNAYNKLKGTFSELKEKYKIVAEAYVELKEKFTKKEEETQEQSNIRRR